MARLTRAEPHGVLVVDKPHGPTSHDVVAGLRKLYDTRAAGHSGTLDPMATGVLVVLFGEATKLSAVLTAADKTYVATVAFGVETNTLDALGTPVRETPLAEDLLEPARLEAALRAESRRTEQVPPSFSAIRVEGRRAHRAARSGQPLQLEPRPVRVQRIDLLSCGAGEVVVRLSVSKGYYVRSFARDLGARLQAAAHLRDLRRTSSGAFTSGMGHAWPLEHPAPLLTLEEAVRLALPVATLTPEGAARARHGQSLTRPHFSGTGLAGDLSAWLDPEGRLVALGEEQPGGHFRVRRGFAAPATRDVAAG